MSALYLSLLIVYLLLYIHADQILVLDNGRLVERGTHEQLLAKKGYYSTVFHHQYGEFDRFKKVRAEKGRGEA